MPLLGGSPSIDSLHIEATTRSCLNHAIASGAIMRISDVSKFTAAELLDRLPALSVESLIDLQVAIEASGEFGSQGSRASVCDPGPNALMGSSGSPLRGTELEHLLVAPHKLASDPGIRFRRFPKLVSTVRMEDLKLSVRVQNCLRDLMVRGTISRLGDLSNLTIDQLLRVKNFGRKSLVNLLSAVAPITIDEADSSDVIIERLDAANTPAHHERSALLLTKMAEQLRAQPYSAHIRCSDVRFSRDLTTILRLANVSSDDPPLNFAATLRSVAHRLVGRDRDAIPPEKLIPEISRIRTKIARARRLTVEAELRQIVGKVVTGRNLEITLRSLGWDGLCPATLQAVGENFGITRGRVQQVTSKFIKAIPRIPFTPVLDRTLRCISANLPAPAAELETRIRQHGLTDTDFRLEAIAAAAETLHRPVTFIVEQLRGMRTVAHKDDAGLTSAIVQRARKLVSHLGLATVGDVCEQLREHRDNLVDPDLVRSILCALSSLHWLDEHSEWFWLHGLPRNHMLTLVTKVLSVSPRIHVTEMRASISNDRRGMGFAPPKKVVLEFCRLACDCEIEDEYIVARQVRPADETLSKAELIAYAVLTDSGPVLHRSEFERQCCSRGMNPTTFNIYLGHSPILGRYAPGVYGLRGARFSPGDLERCVAPQVGRMSDHGWTTDARPWLAVELSANVLSSGVVSVPAGIREFVIGRYLLHTEDGVEIGTLVVSAKGAAWGVKPLFRRRGGEPGDVLSVVFDLQRREAIARLGRSEDILGDLYAGPAIEEVAQSQVVDERDRSQ